MSSHFKLQNLALSLLCTSVLAGALPSGLIVAEAKESLNLELEAYLREVQSQSPAYKAAEIGAQAARATADEAELSVKPHFFASAALNSESKPSPFFNYERIDTTALGAGVSQQFRFGLQTKLSYQYTESNYVGIRPKFFEARPSVEATLPLLRNWGGRETANQIDAAVTAGNAKAKGQEAQREGALLEAEILYWRLALAREAKKVAQDALARAQAMHEWTTRRVRLNLSDRTEQLQSDAQLKARQLEMLQADDDERSARLNFNLARGRNDDLVKEVLSEINAARIQKWKNLTRTHSRSEVEALSLQAQAAELQAQAARERTRPQLELFGQYAWNSPLRATSSDALADSWRTDKPTQTVGLRLQFPLDVSQSVRTQKGWALEAQAAREQLRRRTQEEERDWSELSSRYQTAKQRALLFEELERAQKAKLDHERGRHRVGRAVLAQVIQFETEYQQTQLGRLRSLAEALSLYAQMKLYGPKAESIPEQE